MLKLLSFVASLWLNSFFNCICKFMASVQISDVVIPAVYNSYTAVDNPELTAFAESGVIARGPALDTAFDAGGSIATFPFWNDLDPTIEPNYSTDNPADVAVPNKVGAQAMTVRISNMNQGYSAADLVMQLAGSDPMQRIRNRFGRYWSRVFQRRLIACALGVLNEDVASHAGDMVNSVALETTVGVTSANLFSRAAFTGAAFTLGDQFEQTVAIAVHSLVYKRMVDNDDITFLRPASPDSNLPIGIGAVPFFLGKRVIVDDSMPVIPGSTSGFKYVSILFAQGAFGFGEQTPPVPSEIYRRPDEGNGGGVEQLWERKSWVIHPFGYSFLSASVAGFSPTIAELKLAANWSRLVVRKNVPLAFLITNG